MRTAAAIAAQINHDNFLSQDNRGLIEQTARRMGHDTIECQFLTRAILKTLEHKALLPRRVKYNIGMALRWIETNYHKGDWMPECILFGPAAKDMPRYAELRQQVMEYQSQYNGMWFDIQTQTKRNQKTPNKASISKDAIHRTCDQSERYLSLIAKIKEKMRFYANGEVSHDK